MDKLCTDQLINKLVALLREADPDKFDQAVEKAKKQFDNETKQKHKSNFGKLFDSQIQTLRDRGCPEQIVEILQNQRDSVLQRAGEMAFGEGNIPFSLVIPRTYRSPCDLMDMVQNNDKQGYTYLKPTAISDEFDTPKDPYCIYDVEDGEATLNKSPKEAIDIIKKQSRSSLTAAEVMALTTHTDVLSRHYVYAAGSRCVESGVVLGVDLGSGDRPRLGWNRLDRSGDRWGSPSCGSR